MGDEKNVGEANAGFAPTVLTSKSGRRYLDEASRRAVTELVAAAGKGERAADNKKELERAALEALRRWAEAHDAMKEKDRQLGVAVMLNERVPHSEVKVLAQLKAEEFGKRLALREATEPLLALSPVAHAPEEADGEVDRVG